MARFRTADVAARKDNPSVRHEFEKRNMFTIARIKCRDHGTCRWRLAFPRVRRRLAHKGKAAVIEDAFIGAKSPRGSGYNTPLRSREQSPAASAAATHIASGAEDKGAPTVLGVRKKKVDA